MTQFRILTNGDRFRVQERRLRRLGPFSWWSRWQPWVTYYGPLPSCHVLTEYATRELADAAIAERRERDARKVRGWWPVDYPPIPEPLPPAPRPPARPPSAGFTGLTSEDLTAIGPHFISGFRRYWIDGQEVSQHLFRSQFPVDDREARPDYER